MKRNRDEHASGDGSATTYMLSESVHRRINLIVWGMVWLLTTLDLGIAIFCFVLWVRGFFGFYLVILPLLLLLPVWRAAGPDLRHRLARRWGTHAEVDIDKEGVGLNGELRWTFQDILFCHPVGGSTYFELEPRDEETVFFVYANGMHSGMRFEILKKRLIESLNANNPGALQY
jgi:hypothetical protein